MALRYVHEREAWWRVAVDSKFGSSWSGWCSLEPFGAFGVGLRKNIRKGWGDFLCRTGFEVGDSSKIRFWRDQWFGDVALKEAFHIYLVLHAQRMPLLQLTWSFMVVPISGM
jgi:hypothetical protein